MRPPEDAAFRLRNGPRCALCFWFVKITVHKSRCVREWDFIGCAIFRKYSVLKHGFTKMILLLSLIALNYVTDDWACALPYHVKVQPLLVSHRAFHRPPVRHSESLNHQTHSICSFCSCYLLAFLQQLDVLNKRTTVCALVTSECVCVCVCVWERERVWHLLSWHTGSDVNSLWSNRQMTLVQTQRVLIYHVSKKDGLGKK